MRRIKIFFNLQLFNFPLSPHLSMNNNFLVISLLLLTLSSHHGVAAVNHHSKKTKLLFTENFDHIPPWGDAAPWSTSHWYPNPWPLDIPPTIPTLVESPNRPSGLSMSATLSPTLPTNVFRSEITLGETPSFNNRFLYDREYRISVETYVKQYDFKHASPWMSIIDFHGVPGLDAKGEVAWGDECHNIRSPVSITLDNGQYGVNIANLNDLQSGGSKSEPQAWVEPLTLNTWVKWIIRLKPSKTSKGIVQVWRNGVRVASMLGANQFTHDSCGKPLSPYVYFKIGVYKDFENQGTQEILYDNIKIEAMQ